MEPFFAVFPRSPGVPPCSIASRMFQSLDLSCVKGANAVQIRSLHVPSDFAMIAVKGIFMEKWLCFGSMGVAGLLLLLFLLDTILGIPFGGSSVVVDIFGILVCGFGALSCL